ncbi:hypothetical protein Agub_g15771, partial [Astrephomene gubernaculifera]
EPRLSLGSPSTVATHVAWLNDLEKDAKYQRYGTSVAELLHTFPGRFRPLARNLFTSVAVAQPLCAPSLQLAGAVAQMWQAGYPLRFGVVFHLPSVVARVQQQRRHPHLQPQLPAWQDMDASEQFGRAFLTLRTAFGPAAAWRLWWEVAEEVGSGSSPEPRAAVEAAFSAAWAAAARSPPPGARARVAARKSGAEALQMLQEGAGYAAEAGMQLSDTAAWLLNKGLVAGQPPGPPAPPAPPAEGEGEEAAAAACRGEGGPLLWLNGVTWRGAASGEAAAQELLMRAMSDMQRMQEWVYFGRLNDDSGGGDMLAAVMELAGGGVERLNPRIGGQAAARRAQILPLAPLLSHPGRASLPALWKDASTAAASKSKSGSSAAPPGGPKRVAAVSHYVVADLRGEEGRELVAQALRFLADLAPAPASSPAPAKDARLVLLLNPASPTTATASSNSTAAAGGGAAVRQQPPSLLEALVLAAGWQVTHGSEEQLTSTTRGKVVSFLSRLFRDTALSARLASEEVAAGGGPGQQEELLTVVGSYAEEAGLDSAALLASLSPAADNTSTTSAAAAAADVASLLAVHSEICRTALQLVPGSAAVITNGRVTPVLTRPGAQPSELVAEDFPL